MKLSRLCIYILLSLLSVNVLAQSNKRKARPKQSKAHKAIVIEPEKSEADILFDDMLAGTARLTVIDSTITDVAIREIGTSGRLRIACKRQECNCSYK